MLCNQSLEFCGSCKTFIQPTRICVSRKFDAIKRIFITPLRCTQNINGKTTKNVDRESKQTFIALVLKLGFGLPAWHPLRQT